MNKHPENKIASRRLSKKQQGGNASSWKIPPIGTMDSQTRLLKRWGIVVHFPPGIINIIDGYRQDTIYQKNTRYYEFPNPWQLLTELSYMKTEGNNLVEYLYYDLKNRKNRTPFLSALNELYDISQYLPIEEFHSYIHPIAEPLVGLLLFSMSINSWSSLSVQVRISRILLKLTTCPESMVALKFHSTTIEELTHFWIYYHGEFRRDMQDLLRIVRNDSLPTIKNETTDQTFSVCS